MGALFQGASIAEQPFSVAQPAQIGSKELAQIHAPNEAVRCPIDPPLQTNKNSNPG
jgi:hypothetical protein